MAKRLIVYVSPWCFNCNDTREALKQWGVTAEFVDIKRDAGAAQRVRMWTGFESVPTLLMAEEGSLEPDESPAPLAPGASPRGVDRGGMITEPNRAQLRAWLVRQGLLASESATATPG
jgi:glutaredoxin